MISLTYNDINPLLTYLITAITASFFRTGFNDAIFNPLSESQGILHTSILLERITMDLTVCIVWIHMPDRVS